MSYMIIKGKIFSNDLHVYKIKNIVITSFNVDYNNIYPNIYICMNVVPFLVNNDTLIDG